MAVYAVGLRQVGKDRDARRALEALAAATGGRTFFLESLDEPPGVYTTIQEELRSQYLIAYRSTCSKAEGEVRRVKVEVRGGGDVNAPAGYLP